MSDLDIIIKDLETHDNQGAWDWEADLRFARAIGDTEAVADCQALLRSNAPFALQIAAHHGLIAKTITARRIRALRALVRQGRARAFWLGTGRGGASLFGVNRVRHYQLVG